ncbi:MAG: isochorismatase family protein [Mariprofundaceae bacterium]|nr:isochorismatase family protein [Mariprofundaceae bacterium]
MNLPKIRLQNGDALIVVDVQYDFLPGGALAVPGGDETVAPLNRCLAVFSGHGLPVFATRDWHPPDHCSFSPQGGPWPPHCIAGTSGAAFSRELQLPEDVTIISKATEAEKDAYSGFEDTALHDLLGEQQIRRVFIGGLATDYCVKQTVLDACRLGYKTHVLVDAVRAVNVQPNDEDEAFAVMRNAGAIPAATDEIL